jgi:hypothetical protein
MRSLGLAGLNNSTRALLSERHQAGIKGPIGKMARATQPLSSSFALGLMGRATTC